MPSIIIILDTYEYAQSCSYDRCRPVKAYCRGHTVRTLGTATYHTHHPNTTASQHVGCDIASTTTGLEACYRALRLPVDIRILGSAHHVYKDCILPLEKTALPALSVCLSLISLVVVVSLIFTILFVIFISVHSLLCSVSFGAPLAHLPLPLS